MANGSYATPHLMMDPGFLYWAPLGSTLPTNTVVGSVFTDTWPVAWIAMGMTDAGSNFERNLTTAAVNAAEVIDPLAYRTTGRASTVSFMLKDFTATKLAHAMNGSTLTVTGSTTTTMTQITPPTPGSETRCMIGFESLDSTYRYIAFQVINSGAMKLSFAKAPANTSIPWTGQLEVPSSGTPFLEWTAGVARG